MNEEETRGDTRFESLKGSLLISRIIYKKTNAMQGGIILLAIVLAIKGILWVADWGDAVFALLLIGLSVHAGSMQEFLIDIWGQNILTADKHVAIVMLRKIQEKLMQRGW